MGDVTKAVTVEVKQDNTKLEAPEPVYVPTEKQTLLVKVVIGLTVFFGLLFVLAIGIGFGASGIQYEYSTILIPAFLGFGGLYVGAVFLFWKRKESSRGVKSVTVVLLTGFILALEGFICLVAFAISPGHAISAVLVLLWMAQGGIVTVLAYESRNVIKAKDAVTVERSRISCVGYWTCNVLTALSMGFLQVLIVAFMVQAILAASDYSNDPLGNVYSIETLEERTLYMHLACSGSATLSNVTWIFEHGGGANSLALKGLADAIGIAAGARTCVYDRLGYGWTPSFVTQSTTLDGESTGELLSLLLNAAGESGPYNCVGHSAGAGACLDFAIAESQVIGLGMLDGYPDVIRAGAFRPGNFSSDSSFLGIIGVYSFLAGPTGILRGVVGSADPDFEPAELAGDFSDLYAQSRFWFSQYWDVAADAGSGEAGALYLKTGGFVRSDSLVDYGSSLNVQVVVIPANNTVKELDCELEENEDEFCCGKSADKFCDERAIDREFYINQAQLYANTIGVSPGVLQVAPAGTEHGFPSTKTSIAWTRDTLINNLPS